MILNGKYNNAEVFTDNVDSITMGQIINLCNQKEFKDSKIRIMPDCHAGKGCTIGTTMTITDKVVPNLVGVDIGCFTGDTKIALLNGTQKTLKELYEMQEYFYVYSIDKNGDITYGKATALKTRNSAELVKVTISGGEEIICTPDHRFMMRDMTYKEANELTYCDSLMPLYRTYQTRDGYESIIQPVNKKLPKNTHKLIAYKMFGKLPTGKVVHHIDGDKFNNNPDNLRVMDTAEHNRLHGLISGQRLSTYEFKKDRLEKLRDNGFFDEKYRDKKKNVAVDNIKNYMENNKEHFEEVVRRNAERGSLFFNEKNNDEVMKKKQKLGKFKKIIDSVISSGEIINEENYENHRISIEKRYPKYQKFIMFMEENGMSIEDILNLNYSKLFNNHKVIKVERLDYKEDVYCLNVEEHHNFALASGVFVHNCGMATINLSKYMNNIDYNKLDDVIRKHIPHGFNTHEMSREKLLKQSFKIDLDNLKCNINTDRAYKSVGTLGGGNHFIEVDVDKNDNPYLTVHTGSRNLGKQIAEYYQKEAIKYCFDKNKNEVDKIILSLKDKGLEKEISERLKNISKPTDDLCYLEGDLMNDYLHDMDIAQKYSAANRIVILSDILYKYNDFNMSYGHFVTDIKCDAIECIHNYIDIENKILRKGAISSRDKETVIIPINMRDGIILGSGKGNENWNYSAPHGAGRILSRGQAKQQISLGEFEDSMKDVFTTCVCQSTLDEAPQAYKPIEEIVDNIKDTVDIIDILKPVYNFKSS